MSPQLRVRRSLGPAIAAVTLLATAAAGQRRPPQDHFTTSEQCAVCHIGAPGAKAMRGPNGDDVSPYQTWHATMMANSFRDPYFRAQVRKETESAGEAVQELCLRCHTPMLHHERALAGEQPPRLADAVDDLAADDGVSCTVCHTIAADGLGDPRTFSGRPGFDEKRAIFGPFADVVTRPMQNMVGYTPQQGLHVQHAGLCGSCHTLFTEHHGTPFPEQTPYLEWRNSHFSDERDGNDPALTRTCQQCHMAELPATRIARAPMGFDFRIPERPYRRHTFVGGNAFMLDLLRENADELDVLAEPEALAETAAATRAQLAERTASLSLSPITRVDGELHFAIEIVNRTGHKFPTGYPSRRAWLCIEVIAEGREVFASGRVDESGRLAGVADESQLPHVTTVCAPQDVVVYELVATDPEGAPTTYLTRMVGKAKDNRLLPQGWRADGDHMADIAPVGIGDDPDFGEGGDTVACRIPARDVPAGACEVRVRLLYQTIPPHWVDALRTVDHDEARRFTSLYDAARKVPELVAEATRREGL